MRIGELLWFENGDFAHKTLCSLNFSFDLFFFAFFLDRASSEVTPTPLFARSGIQSSFEQTPVMGSRDALLPASCTPASVRNANGLPPSGQKSIKVTRVNEPSLRGHPHTIIIEGEVNGEVPPPSHLFSQRHYVWSVSRFFLHLVSSFVAFLTSSKCNLVLPASLYRRLTATSWCDF